MPLPILGRFGHLADGFWISLMAEGGRLSSGLPFLFHFFCLGLIVGQWSAKVGHWLFCNLLANRHFVTVLKNFRENT